MKKEKTFKVGDIIRVYGFHSQDAAQTLDRIVAEIMPDHGLLLTDAGEYVHPKQCRRLVKKQRREWWIATHQCSRPSVHAQYKPDMICGNGCKIEWYRVREVLQ